MVVRKAGFKVSAQVRHKVSCSAIRPLQIETRDIILSKKREKKPLMWLHMSRIVRKPAFCICENKNADQLRGNLEADQRLCFRYTDCTIPLLPKSEVLSL